MALETGTYISDLVATNPTSTDPKSEGDNHLRLIKSTVKATFPNVTGAVTKTHTQLNNTVDKTGDTMTGPLAQAAGTAALPSYTFSGDENTGMWSPGADILAWSTAGAERLRIDTSGNVGVGKTPTARLDVNGTSTETLFVIEGSATSAGRNMVRIKNTDTSASNLASINIFSGESSAVAQFAKYGTEYTGVSSYAGFASLSDNGTGVQLGAIGSSGVIRFITGGTTNERMRVDSSGNVLVTGSGGLGYGVGSGGEVTQATSRTTGVTLNKPSGAITLFSTTTTAGTFASFTLTNSSIAATDGVKVCFTSGATANSYGLLVTAVAAGSCRIQIHNIAAVGTAEAPVIRFNVIKGASS